jgi:hypothetical protein
MLVCNLEQADRRSRSCRTSTQNYGNKKLNTIDSKTVDQVSIVFSLCQRYNCWWSPGRCCMRLSPFSRFKLLAYLTLAAPSLALNLPCRLTQSGFLLSAGEESKLYRLCRPPIPSKIMVKPSSMRLTYP